MSGIGCTRTNLLKNRQDSHRLYLDIFLNRKRTCLKNSPILLVIKISWTQSKDSIIGGVDGGKHAAQQKSFCFWEKRNCHKITDRKSTRLNSSHSQISY